MLNPVWKRAWLICGALDIGFAAIVTLLNGKDLGDMLRGVAAGPFPGASQWGTGGALLGLATHFALMAVMIAVFALLLQRTALGRMHWLVSGAIYGVALWLVMYGVVLPLRFGAPFPNPDPVRTLLWFAPHVLCVGWPAAWLLTRNRR